MPAVQSALPQILVGRSSLETVLTAAPKIILIFGVIILTFSPNLIDLIWVFFWVRLFDLIATFFILNKLILKTTLSFDFKFVKTMQRTALPLGMFVYIAFVYGNIDTVMLSFFKGHTEVGWYNAAYRIYEGLIFWPFIIYYSYLPPLSKYFVENKDKHLQISSEIAQYSLIFVLPFCGLLAHQASLIINILFGNNFEQAVPAFKILMIALSFSCLTVIFNCILISMDKLKVILYFAVVGLVLNVICNLMLLPRLGYLGAAVSTAFSEIVVFAITMRYLEKICEQLRLIDKIKRLGLVVSVVVLTVLLCNKLGVPAAFLIGICAFVYAICLILFKLIDLRRASSILKILVSFKS